MFHLWDGDVYVQKSMIYRVHLGIIDGEVRKT